MKKTLLAIIAALCAPAFAQTTTPVWFTVATAAQQALTLSVTLPVGTIYRIGDSVHNKWCTQPTVTSTTPMPIIDYADGLSGHPPDCDPGTAKELDVQETSATQTITLTDNSVKPAKVTTVTVPALTTTTTPTAPTPVGSPVPATAQLMSDGTYVVTLTTKASVVSQ